MPQYIDKSAIVAKINHHLKFTPEHTNAFIEGEEHAYRTILSFLDTLEVKKEVTTTDDFVEKACDWLTKHAKKYYFNKER